MKWRCILITGASSGLGWSLAERLARPGVRLILSGRDEERLARLCLVVREKGASADVCVADLSSSAGQQALIACIENMLPELLIHSAGIGAYGRFVDTPLEFSLDIIRLNIMALMTITHAWCRACISHSRAGKVIFICSASAVLPIPGMATYAASKAFLSSFAEALRFELRGYGISALTVCPGQFATNFQRRAAGKEISGSSSQEADRVADGIISVLHREGVFIPQPWRFLLKVRWLIPQRWLMSAMEYRLLSRL